MSGGKGSLDLEPAILQTSGSRTGQTPKLWNRDEEPSGETVRLRAFWDVSLLLKVNENMKLLDSWHEPVAFKSPAGPSSVLIRENSVLRNKTILQYTDSSPLLGVKTEERPNIKDKPLHCNRKTFF